MEFVTLWNVTRNNSQVPPVTLKAFYNSGKSNGTFLIKGAWPGQMDTLLTCDPANVRCIMSEKVSRYEKGAEWRKRFDFAGDQCLFNTDSEEWQYNRKIYRAFLSHPSFHRFSTKTASDIIEEGLIPALEFASEKGIALDLQDLFQRYTFDFASIVVIGSNPKSVSIGSPKNPVSEALDVAWEAAALRHFLPESIWKLQRWIGFGKERKLSQARKVLDRFCTEILSKKRVGLSNSMKTSELDQESFNFLNCCLTGHEIVGPTPTEKFMAINIVNMIFATADTTSTTLSWFFWIISKNPFVENKIREELERNSPKKEAKNCQFFHLDKQSKLVYLHAALCETLRLFPAAPMQLRTPVQEDILPSGHPVNQRTNILISTYAMARMTSIWGEDCREFKPERWITEEGRIKHEPLHKFFTFNAGPRICLGKDISFIVMTAVVATIIHNYHVQILENHPVVPKFSVFLRMKHGLAAKIKKK